jgi:hypothetical protein
VRDPSRDPESLARAALRRGTVIYAALFLLDVAVFSLVIGAGASGAAYVTLTIVGIVGLLLGYTAFQHIRDVGGPLAESEGLITRKWSRADFVIFMQSYYIMVERVVYKLQPEDYIHLDEGMYVKVVHFPHTLNVVSVHEVLGGMRQGPD